VSISNALESLDGKASILSRVGDIKGTVPIGTRVALVRLYYCRL
jgi:hypothetical protein